MTFKNYSITERQKYNFAIIKELKWNPINYVYKLILINPASLQLPSLSAVGGYVSYFSCTLWKVFSDTNKP